MQKLEKTLKGAERKRAVAEREVSDAIDNALDEMLLNDAKSSHILAAFKPPQ